MAKLTRRQQVFVEEYLTCWNASEAARRSGYTGKPDVIGARLLGNVSIRALVEARMKEKAMGADEVIARLAEQARVNIGDFIEIKTPVHYEHIDPDDDESEEVLVREQELQILYREVQRRGHLVKKIGITKFGPLIEMVDTQSALVQIAKILRIAPDVREVSGLNGGPIDVVHIYIPDNGRDPKVEDGT